MAKSAMTMIRPRELDCYDEEQRIAIMEMVKDGLMTVPEAFAEVWDRAQPVTQCRLRTHDRGRSISSIMVAARVLRRR